MIYHDEIVTGNVLAPTKHKKLLTVCVSFVELRESLHAEHAWLPFMPLQRNVLTAISGGLSAVCDLLVKTMHSPELRRGVLLQLPGGRKLLHMSPCSRLLSDEDAQRGTYNSKGSAGIVMRLYCSNCLSAARYTHVDGAVGIHEWEATKFKLRNDQAFFAAVDAMRDIRRKVDLAFREKALGVNRDLRSILFDPVARPLLLPSQASVDTLHCYFSKGCASWELAFLLRHLSEIGITQKEPLDAAVSAERRLPRRGQVPACSTLRELLHENMLKNDEEGHYRGPGHQTKKLVFLMGYYNSLLLASRIPGQLALMYPEASHYR